MLSWLWPRPPSSAAVPTAASSSSADALLPIVYSSSYNITANGMEKLHPFDACKYGRVAALLEAARAVPLHRLTPATSITEAELAVLHSREYLQSVRTRAWRILELPFIACLPSSYVDARVLHPMRMATGGSMLAARLALEAGWAINLGGGYHHASRAHGHGFCVYADVTAAVWAARAARPCACATARRAAVAGDPSRRESAVFAVAAEPCTCGGALRVLVVDVDAHQGDGVATDLGDDAGVYILDCYAPNIFPGDALAASRVRASIHYQHGDTGARFLRELAPAVRAALRSFCPQLLLYNAGTDTLEGDPLSGLAQAASAIIQRDALVFAAAAERNTPVCMLLSGGYTRASAVVIAESILNVGREHGWWPGEN